MTEQDRPRLALVLGVLGETFREPVSELRAEGYYEGLKDLPIEAIELAARSALQTSKFFPRPAELREQATGKSDELAELAWLAVLREIRRVGYIGTPVLEPATFETVRGLWGSWDHLCATLPGDGPELLGWAKRFTSAYVATKCRLDRPELIGRKEATALLKGITARLEAGKA